jgi:hypothetical protein
VVETGHTASSENATMTVLLRLWKDGDPANATEHPFEQDVVGIGRDPANALPLVRPNVSKIHARIDQREGGLFLTDLKSRNGTWVNGVRISRDEPHPIGPGDKVRVCDFIIEVVSWNRLAPPPMAVDGSIAEEDAERVATLDRKPAAAGETPRLAAAESSIAEENAEHLAAAEQECERLKADLATLEQKPAAVSETPPLAGAGSSIAEEGAEHLAAAESTALMRLKAVLEAVLQPVLKIMRGRVLFRSEFMGATMFQDPKMEALSKRSPQEWIEFFLDAKLSEKQARDRLGILSSETAEMIPHVIGLLDGYRKSIDVGAKNMLQQLNPIRIKEECSKNPVRIGPLSIPHRFLPLVADRIAWKAFEQRHRELQEEDRGILEQRFFRPGFTQGYISCISSAKHEPLPSPPKTSTSAKAEP